MYQYENYWNKESFDEKIKYILLFKKYQENYERQTWYMLV